MPVKSEKVQVADLVEGMYVSDLDRPWIETDYLMEGFYIENRRDIQKLQSLCKHVYIDVELSREKIAASNVPAEPSLMAKIKTIATTDIKDIKFNRKKSTSTIRNNTNQYKKKTTFATEFRTANQLYKEITVTATSLFNDAHTGNSIDMATVKRSATAVVDSVVRNPDAFLWLTRLHEKDTHSHNRSLRTSIWAIAFGRYLGLEQEKLNNLSIALLLCNIGKAKLPTKLLKNEDNLTESELIEYQRHVDLTLEALKIMGRTPQPIITIIRAHCERFDGSGYPMKLEGDEIPLLAQIAGLVTYYEEITNRRTQSLSLDPTRAVEHLYKLRDKKFMGELVEEFIASIGIYPVGSIVELNSKEIAIIIEQNAKNQLLPQVLILRDVNRKPVTLFKVLDLDKISESAKDGVKPKIVNTYALGTFGIDVEEVTQGLARATNSDEDDTSRSKNWGIKSLIKKMVS
jgi:HD-GYP domain-containing protein (c-di-GMP phosphodiesterase class II)